MGRPGELDEYVAHRLDREQRLMVALGEGRRTIEELLDAVWDGRARRAAPGGGVTLAAHLDKLEEEQRLPGGVERPRPDPGAR